MGRMKKRVHKKQALSEKQFTSEGKKLTDLRLRKSSLILFTVIIGISVQFAIGEIIDKEFALWVFFNFGAFLITAIRFFHGNYIHQEEPEDVQQKVAPLLFMIDFYFNIIELIALCIAGRLVGNPLGFIYAMLALSMTDVIWSVFSIFTDIPEKRKRFWVWGSLNAGTTTILVIFLILGYKAQGLISYLIFGAYLIAAGLDYCLCRQVYFGKRADLKRSS